jgi:DNA-binding response OmpR family regulator
VTPARSLAEARAKLAHGRFDLVILDLSLPDGAGEGLLRDARAAGAGFPPVLVFSAEDPGRAKIEGAAAFLVKSRSSNEEVLRAVLDLLGRGGPEPG